MWTQGRREMNRSETTYRVEVSLVVDDMGEEERRESESRTTPDFWLRQLRGGGAEHTGRSRLGWWGGAGKDCSLGTHRMPSIQAWLQVPGMRQQQTQNPCSH